MKRVRKTSSSPKLVPTDTEAQELVSRFCNHVAQLKYEVNIYRRLYEDKKTLKLMETIAHAFFHTFNNILVDHLLLEFAKITDPAQSKINDRENFTLSNLIERIDWDPSTMIEIEKVAILVMAFSKKITPARNRVLAHLDKETVLTGIKLGAFDQGEDKEFLDNLETLCNIMHKESKGIIFGAIGVTGPGDVLDFKKALQSATAFERLFAESKGNEKVRLLNMRLGRQ